MCAQYLIKHDHLLALRQWTVSEVPNLEDHFGCEARIVPHRPAPIVYKLESPDTVEACDFALNFFEYSLIPRWSKIKKLKFATYNARLESIEQKPTWRDSFRRRHCVVPLSSFVEPIYEGDWAQQMVRFSEAGGALLLAAGIWDEWLNRETGEAIRSFALITSAPPEQVRQIGHDRCPVFLSTASAIDWISNREGKSLTKFLEESNLARDLNFRPSSDRFLKARKTVS